MGFLKALFGGRGQAAPPPPPPPPEEEPQEPVAKLPEEVFTGMKVEVLTTANNLIFVGKATVCEGYLELRSESDGSLPQVMYNQEIKLRGFQKNSQTITMQATVCRSSFSFWHVENVEALQANKENRNFFRQNAQIPGTIRPDIPCTILDISASGARLNAPYGLKEGETFVLDTTVNPDEEPFSITCQIRRTTPQEKVMEYGCEFLGLPEREQNRLLQAIFTLQRRILQAKRD